MIDTDPTYNTVIAPVPVGSYPWGVAVSPNGSAYVSGDVMLGRGVIAPAATMHDFRAAIRHLDPQALRYHLEQGDFSRWLDSTIADKDSAAHVAAWKDELLAHQAGS